jgi:hypothetical protein
MQSFVELIREFIQDVVFGNGYIALAVLVLIAVITVVSRLTKAGSL